MQSNFLKIPHFKATNPSHLRIEKKDLKENSFSAFKKVLIKGMKPAFHKRLGRTHTHRMHEYTSHGAVCVRTHAQRSDVMLALTTRRHFLWAVTQLFYNRSGVRLFTGLFCVF